MDSQLLDMDVRTLENQYKTIISAEEALDFNFNESDGPNDSNDNTVSPFVHYFQLPLAIKDLLIVEGTVLKYAKSFKIDFCTWKDDVVLHINPRLDQNYVARNSWIGDSWGQEESCSSAMSPIQRGKQFQFQIFLLEKEFMVCINGVHMFGYFHRISYREIIRMEVFGDVDITKVVLQKSTFYPHPSWQEAHGPKTDLSLPLSRHMVYGFTYFGKISIQGRVKLLPLSFTINIQTTDKVFPHPKMIYHLNGRYTGDGSYLVENSWGMRGEGWDKEARNPLPPALQPGSVFSLSISSNEMYIQTSGPGWKLPPFQHRLNPESGLYLLVHGDIILTHLKISPDLSTQSAI